MKKYTIIVKNTKSPIILSLVLVLVKIPDIGIIVKISQPGCHKLSVKPKIKKIIKGINILNPGSISFLFVLFIIAVIGISKKNNQPYFHISKTNPDTINKIIAIKTVIPVIQSPFLLLLFFR